MRKSRVTLLTAASPDYWPQMEFSGPNKMEYCLRHHITLSMVVHDNITVKNWGERELFMLDGLDSYDTDWLWFMGADTIITNMKIDIRSMCDPKQELIIGVDINGINNDSLLLKNTKPARDFLRRVLCRRDHPNDQSAMFDEKDVLKTHLVNQRLFNSYKYDEYHYGEFPQGTWQPGDFVLHLPGMSNARRLELMREYLPKVVR